MTVRQSWVVKTPEGFLGQRRHNYSGTQPERKASFKSARVFTGKGYAQRACGPNDVVLPVTITLENEEG
jgi:hypothetical protein